ncbi:MAG: universal stress protein [Gemmobacter sp.]
MAYKSLMTIVTVTGDADRRNRLLDAAVALARREDAHLEVLAMGIDRTQIGYFYAGASALIYQETLERAQAEAAELEAEIRDRLGRQDIRWSVETVVAQLGGMSALVAQRAWFADLVVLARPYGEGCGPEDEAVIEAAMFDGQAPVLVLPHDVPDVALRGTRVVVAWNQSSESLSAIRKALPILARADLVNICIVDPPQHGAERSDPGGTLSQWLSRHGIRSEVSVLAKTLPRLSDVLARHMRDQNADLLVMGAYGHSRFREAILGGTTRNTLEQTEVPVFMAH